MAQFYGAGTVANNCTALKGCPMKLHDPIDFRIQKTWFLLLTSSIERIILELINEGRVWKARQKLPGI